MNRLSPQLLSRLGRWPISQKSPQLISRLYPQLIAGARAAVRDGARSLSPDSDCWSPRPV